MAEGVTERWWRIQRGEEIQDRIEEKRKVADMNWDDPVARGQLAEQLGPEGYNEAIQAHLRDSTVATVDGHAIRPVSTRFGRLFAVGGTDRAFRTLAEAENYAASL